MTNHFGPLISVCGKVGDLIRDAFQTENATDHRRAILELNGRRDEDGRLLQEPIDWVARFDAARGSFEDAAVKRGYARDFVEGKIDALRKSMRLAAVTISIPPFKPLDKWTPEECNSYLEPFVRDFEPIVRIANNSQKVTAKGVGRPVCEWGKKIYPRVKELRANENGLPALRWKELAKQINKEFRTSYTAESLKTGFYTEKKKRRLKTVS
jgi:hypothetical protein